jgi:hypothetical protein
MEHLLLAALLHADSKGKVAIPSALVLEVKFAFVVQPPMATFTPFSGLHRVHIVDTL